jgi:hypothetical protein
MHWTKPLALHARLRCRPSRRRDHGVAGGRHRQQAPSCRWRCATCRMHIVVHNVYACGPRSTLMKISCVPRWTRRTRGRKPRLSRWGCAPWHGVRSETVLGSLGMRTMIAPALPGPACDTRWPSGHTTTMNRQRLKDLLAEYGRLALALHVLLVLFVVVLVPEVGARGPGARGWCRGWCQRSGGLGHRLVCLPGFRKKQLGDVAGREVLHAPTTAFHPRKVPR